MLLIGQQNKLAVSAVEPITIKPGGDAVQKLKVTVLPGLHVNSDKPATEYVIPLKLTWVGGPLETKSITYPKPEQIQVGGEKLTVFTGAFEIVTEFQAPRDVKAGSAIMSGKLHYQACNNQMCFRPATIDVRLPVVIE